MVGIVMSVKRVLASETLGVVMIVLVVVGCGDSVPCKYRSGSERESDGEVREREERGRGGGVWENGKRCGYKGRRGREEWGGREGVWMGMTCFELPVVPLPFSHPSLPSPLHTLSFLYSYPFLSLTPPTVTPLRSLYPPSCSSLSILPPIYSFSFPSSFLTPSLFPSLPPFALTVSCVFLLVLPKNSSLMSRLPFRSLV